MTAAITAPSGIVKGSLNLPSSKSISNRLLIIKALCKGPVEITGLSEALDTQLLAELLQSGQDTLNCGHGGTTFRFISAYRATMQEAKTITGSERMKNRPIGPLVDSLKKLGAEIKYLGKEGFPPLRISGGNLLNPEITIRGDISSQFITAILLIAPSLPGGLIINIEGTLVSKPYIDMTLNILGHFGITTSWKSNKIQVSPGEYFPGSFIVEPDWSSASYWYSIVALAKEADIFIEGFDEHSIQGDAVVKSIFGLFGVKTDFSQKGIRLYKTRFEAHQLFYDFRECPDLAQAVIVTAAGLGIQGHFTGLETLRIKETDRINALKTELEKLGATIEITEGDGLKLISGIKKEKANTMISTYNDHRMAMAFAPLSIVCKTLNIENPGVVKKSYPGFWSNLRETGFTVS
ncbi:MAG TPA: 3-phosphoshikimate 1-carboxyvinyltransferase [Flavobacteriales bacterium]|nr:3-phosphoshikimate 1-carboxyvinyltransferase [Flavobacteriales bacterium]